MADIGIIVICFENSQVITLNQFFLLLYQRHPFVSDMMHMRFEYIQLSFMVSKGNFDVF